MTTVNGKRNPEHPYRVGCMCDVCMGIRIQVRIDADLRKEYIERQKLMAWKRP